MLREDSGQTVILAAFCMALLLGFLAMAVDVGLLFHAKRTTQTAADSAAVAGAEEIHYGDVTSAAQEDAGRNGVVNGAGGAVVQVNEPPQSGGYAGKTGYVEVIASQPQKTLFMNVFGRSSVNVTARAVGVLTPSQNCIYVLNPTGMDMSVTGGSELQLPGCGVADESDSSDAFVVDGGSNVQATSIGVVGGYSVTGGSFTTPTPVGGVGPAGDPLAFLSPPQFNASSCVSNPYLGNGMTYTLGSGGTTCYNGLTIGGGSMVTFDPGIYVIAGTLSISNGATVNGSGVMFYLPPGGSVSIGGGAVVNLSAATSGTYNGILFYQDRSDTSSGSISNGSNSVLKGILYFPDASLMINGGTSTQVYAAVIAGSLQFSGGTTLKNYALVNPSTPLRSPRLVE
jgi:hypothetical protein